MSFQASTKLSREQAEVYLAWLDAGYVDTRFTLKLGSTASRVA